MLKDCVDPKKFRRSSQLNSIEVQLENFQRKSPNLSNSKEPKTLEKSNQLQNSSYGSHFSKFANPCDQNKRQSFKAKKSKQIEFIKGKPRRKTQFQMSPPQDKNGFLRTTTRSILNGNSSGGGGLIINLKEINDKLTNNDITPSSKTQSHRSAVKKQKKKITQRLGDIEEDEDDIIHQAINFDEDGEQVEDSQVHNLIQDLQDVKIQRCMLRHNSPIRMRWDLFIILLTIWNCVYIPFNVAFSTRIPEILAISIMDRIIDVCFGFDIILNFRTTFVNQKINTEITSAKKIAIEYSLRGRFFVDLLASIPFELFLNSKNNSNNSVKLKIFGLLKLIRLLRLGRIITYMKFRSSFKIGMRIFQLFFMLIILAHWFGCIWFLVINDKKQQWIPPKDGFQTNFFEVGIWNQYLIVFYYACLMLIGSEMNPRSTSQMLYTAMICIIGQIVFAFIFGNMASLMDSMNKKDSIMQDKVDLVTQTMRQLRLPASLKEDILKYLQYLSETPDLQQDVEKFFNLLSPSLKCKILIEISQKTIGKIDELQNCSEIEISFIVNNLKATLYLPNDSIVRQDEEGQFLYIINSGSVVVQMTKYDYIAQLNQQNQNILSERQTNFEDFTQSVANQQALRTPQGSLKGTTQSILIKKTQTPLNNDKLGQSIVPLDDDPNGQYLQNWNHPTYIINTLTEGKYFGEIALLTNLRRTATIKALDFCTLSLLSKEVLLQAQEQYPAIYNIFKSKMKQYDDFDFQFRRKMIRNVPYFKDLDQSVVEEITYLLKPKRYQANTVIVKKGDIVDQLMFLKSGQITIEVPYEKKIYYFDQLNEGSCFCIFSPFCDKIQQIVNFKAQTTCVIESIKINEFKQIEKNSKELSDLLKRLSIQVQNKGKTDIDYFRYRPPRDKIQEFQISNLIRKKFRRAILTFYRRFQQGEVQNFPALDALKLIQQDRRSQEKELNILNSNLFQQKINNLNKHSKFQQKHNQSGQKDSFKLKLSLDINLSHAKKILDNYSTPAISTQGASSQGFIPQLNNQDRSKQSYRSNLNQRHQSTNLVQPFTALKPPSSVDFIEKSIQELTDKVNDQDQALQTLDDNFKEEFGKMRQRITQISKQYEETLQFQEDAFNNSSLMLNQSQDNQMVNRDEENKDQDKENVIFSLAFINALNRQ